MTPPQNPYGNNYNPNDGPDYTQQGNYEQFPGGQGNENYHFHAQNAYQNQPNQFAGYNYGEQGFGTAGLMGTSTPGAGGWRRLAAYLIDAIIVSIIAGIIIAVFGLVPSVPATIATEADFQAYLMEVASASQTAGLVGALTFYVYATLLQITDFSTVGKRALGIRVTNLDGSKVTLGASALRNLWLLLALIPFIGGFAEFIVSIIIFVMAFQGDKTQGLNDKWAKTRVVMRNA